MNNPLWGEEKRDGVEHLKFAFTPALCLPSVLQEGKETPRNWRSGVRSCCATPSLYPWQGHLTVLGGFPSRERGRAASQRLQRTTVCHVAQASCTQVSPEDCGSPIVVGFRTGLFRSVFALTNVKTMHRTQPWMQ